MVYEVYVCDKCKQRWAYRTDALDHEQRCKGEPLSLSRTLG